MADKISNKPQKFSSQARPDVLNALKEIADREGKQLQAIIEEAFNDLIEKKKRTHPRKHIINSFQHSLEYYAPLYEALSK
ncbi:MAG: hypothetical protein AB1782_11000 [Cyanobacteriota bacterium]